MAGDRLDLRRWAIVSTYTIGNIASYLTVERFGSLPAWHHCQQSLAAVFRHHGGRPWFAFGLFVLMLEGREKKHAIGHPSCKASPVAWHV